MTGRLTKTIKKSFLFAIVLAFHMESYGSILQNYSDQKFLLIDKTKLRLFEKKFHEQSVIEVNIVKSLIKSGEGILKTDKSYSVTFLKENLPPDRNIHSYQSQSIYWWPDSNKRDGIPYIRKDGKVNPEAKKLKDQDQLNNLILDLKKLSLCYYFTKDERFAFKVKNLLDTWFVDPSTKMNPNLNFGQFIPGRNQGSPTGIIETRELAAIPDIISLTSGSNHMSPDFIDIIRIWFSSYLRWLQTSPLGKKEKAMRNNHGTYYDLQEVTFCIFVGDTAKAKQILESRTPKRIDYQIKADGSQPFELVRENSLNYTMSNLAGLCKLAQVSENIGANDLWHYEQPNGSGLENSFEWFSQYLLKSKKWDNKQLNRINNYYGLVKLNSAVASKYQNIEIEKIISLYPNYTRIAWELF
ncbi:Alginate lyase [Dyadobacter koreensis]|uniref:Alginate lyase n=1 Tax=Dyadobacter koreensis TaxID=408657 RepID=A0A1H6QGY3_9BACT|nr:alginate lyase family protein [Dyadobacter koreensis]SEI40244.1 Alginate lyase [Dyadobacter koreensis]